MTGTLGKMTRIVSDVSAYDRKRWKVTLDEGAVTFLLYRGEMKAAGIPVPAGEGKEETAVLSGEAWERICKEILLPRAEKKALFYLKNGDKTEHQIRQKLQEGMYPEEVIGEALLFLKKYRLCDDERFTENYVNSMKESRSPREIEAKLYAKGLTGEAVRESIREIPKEDEYAACEKALSKHLTGDKRKDFAYLARRGFSFDAIEHAFSRVSFGDAGEEISEY